MEGGGRTNSLQEAISISSSRGYLLYNDLDLLADKHNLSIGDLDWVCNELSMHGIILYDKSPITDESFSEDEYDDRAHLDYDEIYQKIKLKCPSLSPFVERVRKIVPPQIGEVQRLKYQVLEGNDYARRRMTEMHLRVALKMALIRSEQFDIDLSDLVGIACVGLINAVDKYNPDENGPFHSYASLWILQNFNRRQPIHRALVSYSAQKRNLYLEAYPILKSHGCTECNDFETCNKAREILVSKLDWDFDSANVAIDQMIPDELFSQVIDNDFLEDINWDYALAEIAHETIQTLDTSLETVVNQELHEVLYNVLNDLSEKAQFVAKGRNGWILNGKEMTLDSIGKQLGVTRERIRQIEKKAYGKLRSKLLHLHIRSTSDYT